MEGTIANFRGGRHTQNDKQMIIVIENVKTKEDAEKLVGKEVIWTSPAKKEIKGKITSSHGGKGAVRVSFEKGMPGQSISNKISIQ